MNTDYSEYIDSLVSLEPECGFYDATLPALTDAEHALVLRSDPDIISDTDCPSTTLVAAALEARSPDERAAGALAILDYFRAATSAVVRRRVLRDVNYRCEARELEESEA